MIEERERVILTASVRGEGLQEITENPAATLEPFEGIREELEEREDAGLGLS